MRPRFTIALIVTLIFAVGFFSVRSAAVCPIPIEYRLGQLDERFLLTTEEAISALLEAEQLWEAAVGRDLFRYATSSNELVVNFIFDQRQARTEANKTWKELLNEQEQHSFELTDEYLQLRAEFDDAATAFERQEADFTRRLAAHNSTVEAYNAAGGAPPGVFEELEREQQALVEEERNLIVQEKTLATLIRELNELLQTNRRVVEQYNENVTRYNQTFGESTEFTQGDYEGGAINIYTFANRRELVLVLAHELGHALGIDHVEGRSSVMYYLLGEQPQDLQLSSADTEAFAAVCGSGNSWWNWLRL